MERDVHGDRDGSAGARADRGPFAVQGQRDGGGQTGEALLPVAPLPAEQPRPGGRPVPLEQVALPRGEVGVLHRQFVPPGWVTAGAGAVRGRQVAQERPERGAVAGDVVQDDQQQMVLRRQPEQGGPHRQVRGEVEGDPGGLPHRRVQGLRLHGDLVQPGPGGLPLQHPLPHLPVHRVQHRAQHVVASGHVRQGLAQCGGVRAAGQPQGVRLVVLRPRALQLVQDPQALLGEGGGRVPGAVRGVTGGRAGSTRLSRAASSATDGLLSTSPRLNSAWNSLRTRTVRSAARRECPPMS
nr:hypothetical protein [Streptomyces griseus]